MFISDAIFSESATEVKIAVRVKSKVLRMHFPDYLWFRFPAHYRDYVSQGPEGFLAGLLPVAMALGEDIQVDSCVSPRFAYGMREYQRVLNAWWPNDYKIVTIDYQSLRDSCPPIEASAVGSSFSGGVDSYYTLLSHLSPCETIDPYRITHCLLVNGFDKDVDFDGNGYFARIFQYYSPLLDRVGVKLITSCANLQHFRLAGIGRQKLHQSFGSALSASALILGGLFQRYYIPASHSYCYETLMPMGAHPVSDHLLGTERLQLIHDGAHVSRADKIAMISRCSETYSGLRVCLNRASFNRNTGQLENCCCCDKCVNTMIDLDLLGRLKWYPGFPQSLRRHRIWISNLTSTRFREHFDLAKREKRWDRMLDLYLYLLFYAGFYVSLLRMKTHLGSLWRF